MNEKRMIVVKNNSENKGPINKSNGNEANPYPKKNFERFKLEFIINNIQ